MLSFSVVILTFLLFIIPAVFSYDVEKDLENESAAINDSQLIFAHVVRTKKILK